MEPHSFMISILQQTQQQHLNRLYVVNTKFIHSFFVINFFISILMWFWRRYTCATCVRCCVSVCLHANASAIVCVLFLVIMETLFASHKSYAEKGTILIKKTSMFFFVAAQSAGRVLQDVFCGWQMILSQLTCCVSYNTQLRLVAYEVLVLLLLSATNRHYGPTVRSHTNTYWRRHSSSSTRRTGTWVNNANYNYCANCMRKQMKSKLWILGLLVVLFLVPALCRD